MFGDPTEESQKTEASSVPSAMTLSDDDDDAPVYPPPVTAAQKKAPPKKRTLGKKGKTLCFKLIDG